jgi:tRNA pseudouridine38-40 synthase
VLAYDGAGFRGFAPQAGQRTVAGELAGAIATVARHRVDIVCAGRTDAGVHALGQVVHVDVGEDVDPTRLVKAVNAMLAPAVVVRHAERVEEDFDARRSARSRHYRYLVLEADADDPLMAPLSWRVGGPLDLRGMAAGADAMVGEHDFRAFCRRPPGTDAAAPIVRRVLDASWSEVRPRPDGLAPHERLLRFDVSASSFCHQMVRTMVGTLVEVGRGRRRPSDVVWMLRSGDRSHAISLAPPQGLCLVAVEYLEVRSPVPPGVARL